MHQVGALYIAEERGAFVHDERGGGTVTMTNQPERQISATAPLAYRAEMDAATIAVLAGIVGVSVAEFAERYGAGAAGAR